jgi:anaerobic magnesium-protoporphyrin IX monomethyl ester cyclase
MTSESSRLVRTRFPNIMFVNLPTISIADMRELAKGENTRWQVVTIPLGILYLSSSVKRSKVAERVGLIDYALATKHIGQYQGIDDFIVELASHTCGFAPDVLAFSLMFSASYDFFCRCLALLKNMWPEATSVVGGNHATNTINHLTSMHHVDYVVAGEGELSLVEFLRQYSSGKHVNVKGIYHRNNLGDQATPLPSDCVSDLDRIHFPDWELIDMDQYTSSMGRQSSLEFGRRHAAIMTSRGCYFRCTFCSSHTVHGRLLRYRSVDNVIEEIKILCDKYRVKSILLEDDLLTAKEGRLLSFLSAVKDMRLSDLEIQCPNALSVNTLTERIIDALIGAGMRLFILAIESGSEYVQQKVIKKNCNLKKATRLVRHLKKKGALVHCFFIFGFPGETRDQMQQTLEYAKSLGADWNAFNIATPLVGSVMYDQFVRMGAIRDEPQTWASTFLDKRSFDTPEMSAEELNDFAYRANIECNFVHNTNLLQGRYKIALDTFAFIAAKYPFHIIAWYCMMKCYQGLANAEQARQTEMHLRTLIQDDQRASEMFAKYGDLMQDFSF